METKCFVYSLQQKPAIGINLYQGLKKYAQNICFSFNNLKCNFLYQFYYFLQFHDHKRTSWNQLVRNNSTVKTPVNDQSTMLNKFCFSCINVDSAMDDFT